MAEQLGINAEEYEVMSKSELQSLRSKDHKRNKTREENIKKQQEEAIETREAGKSCSRERK